MPNIKTKKIVIILPQRLGDTIFYTPAIKVLKEHYKTANIEAITFSQLSADALLNNPDITVIHPAPNKKQIQQICANSDLTINLHGEKIIQDYLKKINIPFIAAPIPDPNKHQCEQGLEFMQSLLNCEIKNETRKYSLYPQTEQFEKTKNLLIEQNTQFDRYILIGCHLGCHGLAKRGWKIWKPLGHRKVWPLKNFLALEAKLREYNPRVRFVLTGSKSEKELGKRFIAKSPTAINLINKTSVLDLAALMSFLKIFITSDTGVLHVACATDVDIVALFGPTHLPRTGPYPMQSNYTIVQASTMTDITVQQVYEAVLNSPATQNIK